MQKENLPRTQNEVIKACYTKWKYLTPPVADESSLSESALAAYTAGWLQGRERFAEELRGLAEYWKVWLTGDGDPCAESIVQSMLHAAQLIAVDGPKHRQEYRDWLQRGADNGGALEVR